jgi:thiol-disulfide isomerase/thioredoxin
VVVVTGAAIALVLVGILIGTRLPGRGAPTTQPTTPAQQAPAPAAPPAAPAVATVPDLDSRKTTVFRLERTGKLDSALAVCLQLLQDCQSRLGDRALETAGVADQYAWLLMKTGALDKAEALARSAYQAAAESNSGDLKVMRERRSTLAGILIAAGRLDEAAAIYANRPVPTQWGVTQTFQGSFVADDGKAHVLVFWEAWCPHCAKAMPQLEALDKQYAGRGINIMGLTQETQNATDDDVNRFIREKGIHFPIVKESGRTASYFGATAVPAFRIIEKGRLIWEGYAPTVDRISTRMLDGLVAALHKSKTASIS